MKKITLIILSLVLSSMCVFCFVSCGEDKSSLPKLSTPELTINYDGYYVSWEKVENATKYEIDVDGILSFVDADTTQFTLMDGETIKVRAIGDGISYAASDWSNLAYISVELPDDEL